jgi:nucleotide-binding universal stress UspA family protein
MLNNILIPLDGTSSTETALPYAVMLAARTGANLFMLYRLEIDDEAGSLEAREYLKQLEMNIADYMAELNNNYRSFSFHQLIARGDPADQLIKAAGENQIDLIVTSTHSHFSRLKSVNIIEKVLQAQQTPVLLVNPLNHKGLSLVEAFRQIATYDLYGKPIVVALDGSLESEIILKPALQVARSLEAPLALLRVTQSTTELVEEIGPALSSQESFWRDLDQTVVAEKDTALKYLQDLAVQTQLADYPLTTSVAPGYPANQITGFARKTEAGLIAMASHVRRGLSELMLGSVTKAVIEESSLPVLVVKREPWTTLEVTPTGQ